jgi:hypothetical protein
VHNKRQVASSRWPPSMDLFLDAVGGSVMKLFDEDGRKKRPALRMTQKNHRYRSQSPPGIRKERNSSSLPQRGRSLTRTVRKGGRADSETESSDSLETMSIAGTFATRTTATSFAGKTTGTSVAQSTLGSVEGLWLRHQRSTSVTRTNSSFHHNNGSVGTNHSQYSGAASATLRRQSTSRGGGGGGGSRSSRGSGSVRSDSQRPHMVDSYHSNETPRKSNEHDNRGIGLEPLPGRRDTHEKNADYAPLVEAPSKTTKRVDVTRPRKEFRSYTQLQPPPPSNNSTQPARSTSAPPDRSRQVQWPGPVEPTQGLLMTTTSSGLQGGASRSNTPLIRPSSRAAAAAAPTAELTMRPTHGNNLALRSVNSTNSASTFGPQPEADSAEQQQQQQPPIRAPSQYHSHGRAAAASSVQHYGHAVQRTRHGGVVGYVANSTLPFGHSVQSTSDNGVVGSVADSLQQYGHPVQSTTCHGGGFSAAASSLQQYGHRIQSTRNLHPVNRQLSRLTEADVETDRDDSVREEDENHINALLARVQAAEEKGLLYLQQLQALRLAVKQWEQHGTDDWLNSKSQLQQPLAYPAPAYHDVRAYPPPRVAHDDSVRAYPPRIAHDDSVRVTVRDFEPRYDERDSKCLSTCVNPLPNWLKSCGCLAHHNISQPATRAYGLVVPLHEHGYDDVDVRGLQYLPNGTARHDYSHHAMTMMPPPDHLMMPQLESSNYAPRMRPQEDMHPFEMATTRSNDLHREVAQQPEHHHGQRQQQHHVQSGGGGESPRHHVPRSKVLPAGTGASSASSRSDSYYAASAASPILRGGPPMIPSAASLSKNSRSAAMARPQAPPTLQQNNLEGRTIVIYPGPMQEQLETGTSISPVHDHSNPYYVM